MVFGTGAKMNLHQSHSARMRQRGPEQFARDSHVTIQRMNEHAPQHPFVPQLRVRLLFEAGDSDQHVLIEHAEHNLFRRSPYLRNDRVERPCALFFESGLYRNLQDN
jgi:hypothetical protein